MAEHADIWHSYASGDRLRRESQILDRWCVQVGRDPAAVERTTAVVADELVRLGVSLFVMEYTHPPYDFADLSAWLRWRDDRHGEA